ncbi:hypothetical protein EGH23_18880 [Halomicroarcula sp. F27]|uniref:Uncharacterized protein n=1 Tax=Haloarcula nitratireducens TaxID=2487749 RepID=A0AAW4PGS4_9EURY|nr:hypothetical protein [Halomicroarcula nitratireducens]
MLDQAYGGLGVHRQQISLRLVSTDLACLFYKIVATNLDQLLPNTHDRLTMRFFAKFGGQRGLHVVLGEEDAAPVSSFGGELWPALGDADRSVGVLAVRPLDEHGLNFGLSAVREEIQRRGAGLDALGQRLGILLLIRVGFELLGLRDRALGDLVDLCLLDFDVIQLSSVCSFAALAVVAMS